MSDEINERLAEVPEALVDAAMRAANDPGSFVKRAAEWNGGESMSSWQRRAMRTSLRPTVDALLAEARREALGEVESLFEEALTEPVEKGWRLQVHDALIRAYEAGKGDRDDFAGYADALTLAREVATEARP